MDWKEKTMVHWDLINTMARRRFGSSSFAEEASLFVLERLAENDWRRLKNFSKKSSFRTFFSSIIFRLLEDFAREKFGRKQAPLWIRKLGGLWLDLFRLLCLERMNLIDAVEHVLTRLSTDDRENIEEKGLTILENVTDCGVHQSREVSINDEQLCQCG